MNYYQKNNGMGFVYLIGFHPMKDFVAVSGGENDIRWVPYNYFHENYTLFVKEI